jgi:integrase
MNKLKWDSLVTGLHTKTLPSGKQTYNFYYRTKAGVQRRPKLGDCDQMSLADARALARELRLKVLNGTDPKLEQDVARQELTIEQMFERTWAAHWDQPRFHESRWAKEVAYNYKNHIRRRFGALKMSSVTTPLIREWHRSFRESSPNAGNRSLDVLSRLYSFAEEEGLRPYGSNPCSAVTGHTEKKRERVASREEIVTVCSILDRERDAFPREVAFIYTLMFTGARPRSLERAKKDEIKFFDTHAVLTFNGKGTADSGQKEHVVIPRHVADLISRLPKSFSPNIFGIRMPTAFWNRIKREAGCPDLWIRDWRRTFASIALSSGTSAGVVGELLNHKSAQTTKLYAKLLTDSRVEAVQNVAEQIKNLLGETA